MAKPWVLIGSLTTSLCVKSWGAGAQQLSGFQAGDTQAPPYSEYLFPNTFTTLS